MEGKCIIFSAPSGAGKTTIVQHLLEQGLGLAFSVSATSRSKRENEVDGKDYYFLSVEEFRRRIREGAFIEWEEVYEGRFYGTLRSEIERIWKKGQHVIFDVDVVGGLNLKKTFGDRALAVFVQPPSLQVLEDRIRDRGSEDEETLHIRLEKAQEEMSYADRFDVVILNEDLSTAFAEAEKVVKSFLA